MNSLHGTQRGFSLPELLVVIAVVGIIASIVIASITGSREFANEVMARQQQAELQTALGAWIASASSQSGGLAAARQAYTNEENKLLLLSNYLQVDTFSRLQYQGVEVTSDALTASGAALYFSADWSPGESPMVTWSNQ